MNRQKDVDGIRRLARLIAPSKVNMDGGCIYLAAATIFYMARIHSNRDIHLQAGTAQWPRVTTREQDDGECATHYSYVFEADDPATQAKLMAGELPECHAWCFDRKTGCLIDLSVGSQVAMCKKTTGMDWPGPLPPDYIWHKATKLPDWTVYSADPAAIAIAEMGIKQTIDFDQVRKFLREGKV